MSNIRKRNRRLARRIAVALVGMRDPIQLGAMLAALPLGGVPRKPARVRRKSGRWTIYPTHSQETPHIPVELVSKIVRRMVAKDQSK